MFLLCFSDLLVAVLMLSVFLMNKDVYNIY